MINLAILIAFTLYAAWRIVHVGAEFDRIMNEVTQ